MKLHYHVHNLSNFRPKDVNDLLTLFNYEGKVFKCSCYLIENGKPVKNCNKQFTFKKKVFFFKCDYYINGTKNSCEGNNFVEYNLEKVIVKSRKKTFFIP